MMSNHTQAYDTGAIHKLLCAAFTAKELERFCRYRPDFSAVLNEVGEVSLNGIADRLIIHCEKRHLFDELVAEVKNVNLRQYERFADSLGYFDWAPVPCIGKVCALNSGWDLDTFFVRQDHFHTMGLPIGTKVTIQTLDTDRSVSDVTLSVDRSLTVCSVRLSKSLRDLLEIADTDVKPIRLRPDRQFTVTPTSRPGNRDSYTCQGKVCKLRKGQRKSVVYLRDVEYREFGVPAGTMVSITALATGQTVEHVTIARDTILTTCAIRLSKSVRVALGMAGTTNMDPPSTRPDYQFEIRVPRP